MEIPELNLKTGTELLAAVGALNWGLMEAIDMNLVTELLGTGSEGAVYLAVGVAGALALAEQFELADVYGE